MSEEYLMWNKILTINEFIKEIEISFTGGFAILVVVLIILGVISLFKKGY